ncbi:myb/SANT-like DNA-binding domain-containing protein 3 isoform X2 [Falco cherrug]|uniref:myb/SANT-like DNA-binding domain-containing protein 3 isoform X2 n=1 Tax=Falco cherrug TaxID=345164 RepID=UPI00247AC2EC|nr:myb/SANT-like DNA-binding domain-containing protein 3 isoform X2 [Falco cherrug]XP_055559679.1 myb/SANT-like DNA-binding domain-containing protein 3 isoform X2 [Falco cherrug]
MTPGGAGRGGQRASVTGARRGGVRQARCRPGPQTPREHRRREPAGPGAARHGTARGSGLASTSSPAGEGTGTCSPGKPPGRCGAQLTPSPGAGSTRSARGGRRPRAAPRCRTGPVPPPRWQGGSPPRLRPPRPPLLLRRPRRGGHRGRAAACRPPAARSRPPLRSHRRRRQGPRGAPGRQELRHARRGRGAGARPARGGQDGSGERELRADGKARGAAAERYPPARLPPPPLGALAHTRVGPPSAVGAPPRLGARSSPGRHGGLRWPALRWRGRPVRRRLCSGEAEIQRGVCGELKERRRPAGEELLSILGSLTSQSAFHSSN